MSKKLQPVRGTHDVLPETMAVHRYIGDTAREVAALYGFAEMAPPVFEFSEVFHRTLGETSDVVSKETYSFADRGGESVTLRPELTAGIARAFISNGLQQQMPFKAFYAGPAFRYERPQKGRQRQFHQFGVELLGAAQVQADIEVIACSMQVLEALGLGALLTLQLNTLGDAASRAAYREALVVYFVQHKEALSEDSKMRLEKNPLRILDSKDAGDKQLIAGAPQMHAYLNDDSRRFWGDLRAGLSDLGIDFTINDTLVRGLDYYNHTVFEITTDALGAQGTVLAGGRYDGLIEMMGGSATPGVGFAAGMERLVMLLEAQGNMPALPAPIAVVVPMGDAQQEAVMKLAQQLRLAGIITEMGYNGNMGKRMKKANALGAAYALVLGEDEVKAGTVSVKNLGTGAQEVVALGDIVAYMSSTTNSG